MRFEDHLSKEQRQQLKRLHVPATKRKKQEHLSRRDWEDIMGMHMDTYTRRNGAVRRK
jgi:hypothetical protein